MLGMTTEQFPPDLFLNGSTVMRLTPASSLMSFDYGLTTGKKRENN